MLCNKRKHGYITLIIIDIWTKEERDGSSYITLI